MEGQFSDAEEESGIKRKLSGSCQKTLERKVLDVPSAAQQHNNGNMDSHTDDELQYFSDESDDFYDEEASEYWNDDAIAAGRLSAVTINGGVNVGNKPLHPNRQDSGKGFSVNTYASKNINVNKFQPSEICVFHDELDLPFLKLKTKIGAVKIAEKLEIPLGTVKTHARRGLMRMRELLRPGSLAGGA